MGVDTQPTDEALAALVQSGELAAFGTLVERYEKKLLRYGKKFLAIHEDIQDIVQDVFMNTYQNIRSFDTTARFSPWIYRIAHNAFVDELKKRSRQPLMFIDFDTLLAHPVYDDPAPKERERQEMNETIERGINTLPPNYREVLILYYMEELSYKDIAEILGVPQGTVGIRLMRAKDALKKLLPNPYE